MAAMKAIYTELCDRFGQTYVDRLIEQHGTEAALARMRAVPVQEPISHAVDLCGFALADISGLLEQLDTNLNECTWEGVEDTIADLRFFIRTLGSEEQIQLFAYLLQKCSECDDLDCPGTFECPVCAIDDHGEGARIQIENHNMCCACQEEV